jgi:hypothetical protein
LRRCGWKRKSDSSEKNCNGATLQRKVSTFSGITNRYCYWRQSCKEICLKPSCCPCH